MRLVLVLAAGHPYDAPRKEIHTSGVNRVEEVAEELHAFNSSGAKVGQWKLAHIENYHLEED